MLPRNTRRTEFPTLTCFVTEYSQCSGHWLGAGLGCSSADHFHTLPNLQPHTVKFCLVCLECLSAVCPTTAFQFIFECEEQLRPVLFEHLPSGFWESGSAVCLEKGRAKSRLARYARSEPTTSRPYGVRRALLRTQRVALFIRTPLCV